MRKANLLLQKGKFHSTVVGLEKQISMQTKIIKELLPKKVNDKLVKYLTARGVDVYKTRSNFYSEKMAKKGRFNVLGFEFLNKTGLEKSKKLIKKLIKIGKYGEYAGIALGAGTVLYDTYQAYQQRQQFTRTFLSGAVGVGAGIYLGCVASSSAWGACTIGLLAGDAALGGLVLASSPIIGTIVLAVVGTAILGYASYKVSQGVKQVLKNTETGKNLCSEFDAIGRDFFEMLADCWRTGEKWILDFYGRDSNARYFFN
jgi:hypothetical protein